MTNRYGSEPEGGVLNEPFPASPSEEMLYSYFVFGCRDVSVVRSVRRAGEERTGPVDERNVTPSPCTTHATVALREVTFTTKGPPTIFSIFSAAVVSWAAAISTG